MIFGTHSQMYVSFVCALTQLAKETDFYRVLNEVLLSQQNMQVCLLNLYVEYLLIHNNSQAFLYLINAFLVFTIHSHPFSYLVPIQPVQ